MSKDGRLPDRIDTDAPIFVISVAAQLAEMHPQTLRGYDRLGLVVPGRTRGRAPPSRARIFTTPFARVSERTRIALGPSFVSVSVLWSVAETVEYASGVTSARATASISASRTSTRAAVVIAHLSSPRAPPRAPAIR